ncbi:MAG: RNA pyrophosphohydrolase [Gammaproteobacteria bacterium]|nr:RNA pyrophosphohydrolase [Gammaproteobacteria bacterium]
MIDPDGFRPNVGIILSNEQRRLFWGRRIGQNAWQFPQGGIRSDETPLEAMYRELEEEVGLLPEQVTVLGCTQGWLRYRLPRRFIRRRCGPICIGQKQVWFMLRVDCGESSFCLDRSEKPEFDAWRWVRYWHPLREVVYFKRHVYAQALEELAPLLYPEGTPQPEHPEESGKAAVKRHVDAPRPGGQHRAPRVVGQLRQRRR